MWIKQLQLKNVRGFEDPDPFEFSRGINLFVGSNNTGKSSILGAAFTLQDPGAIRANFVHTGAKHGEILYRFGGIDEGYVFDPKMDLFSRCAAQHLGLRVRCGVGGTPQEPELVESSGNVVTNTKWLKQSEPSNLFYPFLSRRKVQPYAQDVRLQSSTSVMGDLRHLVAKIDRIANPYHPANDAFETACQAVLGFSVTSFPSPNGKQAGLIVSSNDVIPLESMGEGVASVAGLLVSLCDSKDKIFIIEELENDIHPKALKELLRLVANQATQNQFLISTHSNIVTKYLGAVEDSRLFSIDVKFENRVPKSTFRAIGPLPEQRREILEDLGYELIDFDVWKGWLILEESSAERIVREYLIPWFAPSLTGALRTVAVGGISKVVPTFDDFNRLFLFVHLEEMYRNRAWVAVDGDDIGKQIIDSLRETYCRGEWLEDRFRVLSQSSFEHYYPPRFNEDVSRVLELVDREDKRQAKKQLLTEVLDWIEHDTDTAKEEFQSSASEWITLLVEIEEILKAPYNK